MQVSVADQLFVENARRAPLSPDWNLLQPSLGLDGRMYVTRFRRVTDAGQVAYEAVAMGELVASGFVPEQES